MNCGLNFVLLYCYYTVNDFLAQFKIPILLFVIQFPGSTIGAPSTSYILLLTLCYKFETFYHLGKMFSPFKLIKVNLCLFVRLLPHWFPTNKPEQFYNLWRLPRICFTTLAVLRDGLHLHPAAIFQGWNCFITSFYYYHPGPLGGDNYKAATKNMFKLLVQFLAQACKL